MRRVKFGFYIDTQVHSRLTASTAVTSALRAPFKNTKIRRELAAMLTSLPCWTNEEFVDLLDANGCCHAYAPNVSRAPVETTCQLEPSLMSVTVVPTVLDRALRAMLDDVDGIPAVG